MPGSCLAWRSSLIEPPQASVLLGELQRRRGKGACSKTVHRIAVAALDTVDAVEANIEYSSNVEDPGEDTALV